MNDRFLSIGRNWLEFALALVLAALLLRKTLDQCVQPNLHLLRASAQVTRRDARRHPFLDLQRLSSVIRAQAV
jgi:hypothetical protein